MSVKCRAKNPGTCRVHGNSTLKGLRDFSDNQVYKTLKQYNDDYDYSHLFLNDEDREILHRYTGAACYAVNNYLYDRTGYILNRTKGAATEKQAENLERWEKMTEDFIESMDNIFAKVPAVRERQLYRVHQVEGLHESSVYNPTTLHDFGKLEKWLNTNYTVGSTVTFNNFLSTTLDTSLVAGMISKDTEYKNIVFEMQSTKGVLPGKTATDKTFNDMQDYEREVILPRDMKFKVTAVRKQRFGAENHRSHEERKTIDCYVITLEEVLTSP